MYKEIQKNHNKYRTELIEKATNQELIVKEYLKSLKLNFIFQKGFLKPYHRICDFYIKKYRLIVEIDGEYHITVRNKDLQKDKVWKRFRTLRILNKDVDNGNYKHIFEQYLV